MAGLMSCKDCGLKMYIHRYDPQKQWERQPRRAQGMEL